MRWFTRAKFAGHIATAILPIHYWYNYNKWRRFWGNAINFDCTLKDMNIFTRATKGKFHKVFYLGKPNAPRKIR